MIKKISIMMIACLSLFASFAYAANSGFVPKEGKEYVVLDTPRSTTPQVLEFFSFYCPHCYNFEMKYKIPQKIRAALPSNATFDQYHVNFIGQQSKNLTKAWALAMVTGNTEKVENALFNAVRANEINSMQDIRQVFIDSGVSAQVFDDGINSFAVDALAAKQANDMERYNVQGVPDFVINQHYRVNVQGFSDVKTEKEFIDRYVATVLYLLNK